MRTDDHRQWRHSLGAYVLGDLPADERAAVAAHLEGCTECRAEARSLEGVAAILPLADPARIEEPAPRPPADLGARIAATIEAEAATTRGRRKRRRLRWTLGSATAAAAVAAVLLVVVLAGGGTGSGQPEQTVTFAKTPKDIDIDATLEPHAFGTEIHMYVRGIRSGTLCRVFLRDADGRVYPAGSFRYRWGDDADAVLSSALDISRATAIGVHAGNRTFVAPIDRATAMAVEDSGEEPT
jgi:Putative zinc-finger